MTSLAIRRILAGVLGVLGLVDASAQLPPERAAIAAIEHGQELQISVPAGAIEMRLPKLGFVSVFSSPGGEARTHPRYFLLENRQRELYMSGWFEHASKFKGLHELWEEEVAARPSALPKPQDVFFGDAGGWKTVAYTLPSVKNDATIAHVRAHWTEADTWIDLHLSAQDARPLTERFATLTDLLRSIRVNRKSSTSETTHVVRTLPGNSGQVALDLPATERIYVYDLSVAGNPGYGVEGALLLARVGAGTVSLQSLPRAPHQHCDARVFALVLALVGEKRVDPVAVKVSKHQAYSLHVFPRLDDQVKQWHAIFPLGADCLELLVAMPRHLKDDAPLVRSMIESMNVTK